MQNHVAVVIKTKILLLFFSPRRISKKPNVTIIRMSYEDTKFFYNKKKINKKLINNNNQENCIN